MRVTPIMLDGTRGDMDVDDGFVAQFRRGENWTATVTDRKTGKAYVLRGAECAIPKCFCDAVVVMECK